MSFSLQELWFWLAVNRATSVFSAIKSFFSDISGDFLIFVIGKIYFGKKKIFPFVPSVTNIPRLFDEDNNIGRC